MPQRCRCSRSSLVGAFHESERCADLRDRATGRSDVVAAIDLAYDPIAAAGVGWLGTKGAREVPGDTLAALCFSLLVFADRALEDEWLRAYLGLEGAISCDSESLASTLRVINVMCGE